MLKILKARTFVHEPVYEKFYFFGDDLIGNPLALGDTIDERRTDIGYYSCPCTCRVRYDTWSDLHDHIKSHHHFAPSPYDDNSRRSIPHKLRQTMLSTGMDLDY